MRCTKNGFNFGFNRVRTRVVRELSENVPRKSEDPLGQRVQMQIAFDERWIFPQSGQLSVRPYMAFDF